MAETNNTPYISLVRATAEEIERDYKEHINGQVIFDKTNKTIMMDEEDQRYVYSGKSTSEALVDNVIPFNYDEIKNNPSATLEYFDFDDLSDFKLLEGKLFLTNDGILCIIENARFKPTTLEEVINNKYTFELKGSDLYITQNF